MSAAYSQGIAPYLAQFPRQASEAQALCAAVRSQAGGRALRIVDLGTGLGLSAMALAADGHELVAVEPDAEMAAVAGARLAAADEALRHRFALLPSSAGLASGSADLLLCQSVLHLLPTEAEQLALLREAARLLQPAGQLWLELPLPSTQRKALPWALIAETQLGSTQLQHHREMHAEGEDWVTEWRFEIRQGEALLASLPRRFRWRPPAPAQLAALARQAGLELLAIGADWAHTQAFDAQQHSYGYPRCALRPEAA